jgi:hypothetical protein
MKKIAGSNLFTHQIAQFLEVSLVEALEIQNYIDEWLEVDWSEASNTEIEVMAQVALQLMKEDNNG